MAIQNTAPTFNRSWTDKMTKRYQWIVVTDTPQYLKEPKGHKMTKWGNLTEKEKAQFAAEYKAILDVQNVQND